MEVFPSEYQSLDLTRYEKMFMRHALSVDDYGFLLLRVNPAMQKNDDMDIVVLPQGIVLCKFFDEANDITQFSAMITAYSMLVYPTTRDIIANKFLSNKSLRDDKGNLKFAVSIIHIFPNLKKADVEKQSFSDDVKKFINNNCMFSEEFSGLRNGFISSMNRFLSTPIIAVSTNSFSINDNNVNSILHSVATEYVTVRVATVKDEETSTGVDNELLIVDENDIAVKAFRLDQEQINIVNKINKGDQLILACAGSGKSVLLISKCFKAARMNPDKQFLITCYNRNLRSLYTWFIDRAGLRANNVKCMTFHALCRTLLLENGLNASYSGQDGLERLVNATIQGLNNGRIKNRYYGIFIDEVQIFEPEWYKFCYNLLENKSSDDHLFVICGDKTQDLDKRKKQGTAPWQAGEGYPNYRGGNKNIRIERNYRNCIEINEFINRYVSNAKKYLFSIDPDFDIDPDLFLRGQAVSHGIGVDYCQLTDFSNDGESTKVIESIKKIHDEYEIPYDEIAVIMYNASYNSRFPNWSNRNYSLEIPLMVKLRQEDIPFCKLYATEGEWQDNYGETGGVRLIKFQSTLGLDFRAAIICGLKPFGHYDAVKKPNWSVLKTNSDDYSNAIQSTHQCIRNLYVACTRAKEVLHIIAPENEKDSVFIKILKDSI